MKRAFWLPVIYFREYKVKYYSIIVKYIISIYSLSLKPCVRAEKPNTQTLHQPKPELDPHTLKHLRNLNKPLVTTLKVTNGL